TDDPARLAGIVEALGRCDRQIVLPLHPRTRKTLGAGLAALGEKVRVIDPVPYLDMLMLESAARLILTDSGGVQKEAYWFDVPCVTLRDETEWVELVSAGCNTLAGAKPGAIAAAIAAFESGGAALPSNRPRDLYGNGQSAAKIVQLIASSGI
ncbi:MAG: UDP-N-acetylglucosamine 2-epimerase, partial [Phycisphaerae bacterium]|nr:UDP-N-acetylglucosamine 2-epimerase [Phycisphaerae bacterium]